MKGKGATVNRGPPKVGLRKMETKKKKGTLKREKFGDLGANAYVGNWGCLGKRVTKKDTEKGDEENPKGK